MLPSAREVGLTFIVSMGRNSNTKTLSLVSSPWACDGLQVSSVLKMGSLQCWEAAGLAGSCYFGGLGSSFSTMVVGDRFLQVQNLSSGYSPWWSGAISKLYLIDIRMWLCQNLVGSSFPVISYFVSTEGVTSKENSCPYGNTTFIGLCIAALASIDVLFFHSREGSCSSIPELLLMSLHPDL